MEQKCQDIFVTKATFGISNFLILLFKPVKFAQTLYTIFAEQISVISVAGIIKTDPLGRKNYKNLKVFVDLCEASGVNKNYSLDLPFFVRIFSYALTLRMAIQRRDESSDEELPQEDSPK